MKVLMLFDLIRKPRRGEKFNARKLEWQEDKPTEADVLRGLLRLGHTVEPCAVFDNVVTMIDKIKTFEPDVVFNLTESFHSTRRNEPNIPALLELMKVRYTGSQPEALLLCKDKPVAKKVLAYEGVRVARFVVSAKKHPLRRLKQFVFPAFVKPISEESSDGISQASFVRNEAEAIERAHFIHESIKTDALIEEYIDGRELYVSVLGNERPTVFPAREIFFRKVPESVPKFATFNAKWDTAYRKRWGIKTGPPAPLSEALEARLVEVARTTYRALKIRGPGRIDVRLTKDDVVVIEANPNPSLAREDDFAQSAAAGGIEYDQLLQRVLDAV